MGRGDDTRLDRGRAARQAVEAILDAGLGDEGAQLRAAVILAGQADEPGPATPGGEVQRDIRRAAGLRLGVQVVDDRDGRFRGNPVDGAVDIPVEHGVADDHGAYPAGHFPDAVDVRGADHGAGQGSDSAM